MAQNVNHDEDIMKEPDKNDFKLMRTKKGKIVSFTALGILGVVIVWCALYQLGFIDAIKF